MQNCFKIWPDLRKAFAGTVIFSATACGIGCAAPGNPLPPTLNLPAVQAIYPLSAVRVGGEVRLHWTTPTQTTDKLPVKGGMQAIICRSVGATVPSGCDVVLRTPVTSGASDIADTLPSTLASGAPGLLAYRIRLLNAAGRDAGASAPVYAASGAAPSEVVGFAGEVTNAGVMLRWQPDLGGGLVELERTLVDGPHKSASAVKNTERLQGADRNGSPAAQGLVDAQSQLPVDAGGVVDRTVEIGGTYRYTAQRVQRLALAGHPVELRTQVAGPLTFSVQDVFPPSVPQGLVAAPGFAQGKPVIELSWEPVIDQDVKPRVAGYKVYRREGEDWRLLGTVTASAYRDAAVAPTQAYSYRVTAVSTLGHESQPSGDVSETAPQIQP
jgi:hypothetical protein